MHENMYKVGGKNTRRQQHLVLLRGTSSHTSFQQNKKQITTTERFRSGPATYDWERKTAKYLNTCSSCHITESKPRSIHHPYTDHTNKFARAQQQTTAKFGFTRHRKYNSHDIAASPDHNITQAAAWIKKHNLIKRWRGGLSHEHRKASSEADRLSDEGPVDQHEGEAVRRAVVAHHLPRHRLLVRSLPSHA
jgi:hypothetical protein